MADNIQGKFTCLICGQQYEEGQIYQIEERLLEAKKAAQVHVQPHLSATMRDDRYCIKETEKAAD